MAKLHFKYGAMNSGKSDTLIKTAYNYTEQGLRVLVVKPSIDTKGASQVMARAGGVWQVDILAGEDMDIESAILERHKAEAVHCVLVDESQFLSTDQIDQLYCLAKYHDISIICYGLRIDFTRHLFTGSARLFELADNIEKIPTMCRCGSQAEANIRRVDGKAVFAGDQVAIDDHDSITYDSLCGRCYISEMNS